MTNNDLQNMYTYKTKDRITRTPLKTSGYKHDDKS